MKRPAMWPQLTDYVLALKVFPEGGIVVVRRARGHDRGHSHGPPDGVLFRRWFHRVDEVRFGFSIVGDRADHVGTVRPVLDKHVQ